MNNKKKKPQKSQIQHKPKNKDSHYCWVCGQHKANEKFSGKGYANHMCKKCQSLPVAERNEMVAVRKAGNMGFRYLNEQEIKWLRKKMNAPRPDVREAAREAHSLKFPRYERNMIKKSLTARSLEFYINGEVWDEYGDNIHVHMRFFADETGVMRWIDYNAPPDDRETEISIGKPDAKKFLKSVVHHHDAVFWSDDLSDSDGDDYDFSDLYHDMLPGHCSDFDNDTFDSRHDESGVIPVLEEEPDEKEPIWSLRLSLTKGIGEKVQTFYNQMHENPQDLFWDLMAWFEPETMDEMDGFDE